MAIKFSELSEITTQLDNQDIFVLTDTSEGISRGIAFSDLKVSIVDANTFSENSSTLINSINSYDSGDGTNGLNASLANNATNLDGQSSSYYLDYTNATNKPTDLNDFNNTTGFVKVQGNDLVFENISNGSIVNRRVIDTDDLTEGDNNLFFTDSRARDFFDDNFSTYYSNFSTTFDEGNARDSLFDTPATFVETSGSGQQIVSSKVRITDTERYQNYSAGQTLRVYGATTNLSENVLSETVVNYTVDTPGFPLGTDHTFNYRIAQFDYTTGEVAPAKPGSESITVDVPDELPNGTSITEAFNDTYFIRVNFNEIGTNQGVLLYRNFPERDGSTYKLIAVLGPKDLENGFYIDYYNFDWNTWTGKEIDNSYGSIVHFPLSPPNSSRRGWEDVAIEDVTETTSGLELQLSKTMFVNSDRTCFLAHNDTENIQLAINSNSEIGRKTVTLNAKQYVSAEIEVPNNFNVQGASSITRIVKLPWSGSPNQSHLIKSKQSTQAKSIIISGVDIFGNSKHQILWPDNTNEQTNYAINLGFSPRDCLLDQVRLTNPIGGGIYAPEHKNLRITNTELKDSGVTDRYRFSPIIALNGENLIITGNVYQNFTDHADLSVTNKGCVTNNIVSNCGSGILVYGSKFLISAPNVLVGPAGEFLPTPDTLNSEYDSVNISLDNAYLSSGQYTSAKFKYQENGFNYDLTANTNAEVGGTDGSIANIFFTTFAIEKDTNGIEGIYSTDIDDSITLNSQTGLDTGEGEFGFTISQSDVEKLVVGDYSYNSLRNDTSNPNHNPNHVGVGWSASFEHEVYSGDIGVSNSFGDDQYQVEVLDVRFLSVGSRVRLRDHLGSDVPDENGTIVDITDVDQTTSIVTIEYPGSTIDQAGSGGTINIIDKFVMAKGRILS